MILIYEFFFLKKKHKLKLLKYILTTLFIKNLKQFI